MSATFLEVQDLKKSYGDLEVLKDISFTMEQGEKLVVLGPSGSGKSTALRCINRLEEYQRGTISLQGQDICNMNLPQLRQQVGMVFQRFNVFSHMNVLQNIMEAPVHVLKKGKKEAREQALSLLSKVGLSDKATYRPDQLSGGQLQRVAIARALAMEPLLLLFDEPTSALDPELVGEVLKVMRDIAESGTTMIVVTHEMNFARNVADRILFMDGGHILADEPPATFFRPNRDDRIASFIAKVVDV
ncbi:MAG: amino acid ABC transporter ATP-binding protein [Spirochaetia bacterium]|jgi:ABC-type polar amino acid transport system ATPase subunit|nr:amino acid ABC transporter ATP-binding protein [Spirochaetia bacterium]